MFKSTILKKDTATAPHRSLLRATGLTGADFADNKPFIGIANSYTTVVPGHIHLDELTEEVMRGVRDAGGVPFVWGVPAVCDGIAMFVEMRLSLPSRDHIADNIEIMTLSHSFDGWVGVTNCDKITPGMLMAAGRLNLPSMILTGGPMAGGKGKDDKKLDLVSVFEAVGGYKNKKISREDLKQVECSACPSAGSCAGLFTANSMACMTECLGMSVTDCAATLATDPAKKEQAYQTGRKIVELTKQGVNARDIMTKEAFDDCMTLDNAIGGSTNVTLHLPAIAEEAGIDIDLHDFDQISKTTPNLCHLSPVGKDHMEDLHRAGGIKAVMNRLADKMTLDRQSVNGNLQKAIATAKVLDDEVIRPLDNPFYIEGGVAALVGNFCEESVIKQTGVTEDMLTHQWPAKVFYSEQDLLDGIEQGKIIEGDIVILPFQGPAGAPGMPEMLTPTAAIKGAGFKKVVLITDGRFSGGTTGPCIGHVFPEAYNGGRIAFIKDGDIISVDIKNRKMDVDVSDDEFVNRMEGGIEIPERKMTKMLEKFRRDYAVDSI